MDKKSHLLSSLKKQVIALKSQLEGLQKNKASNPSRNTHTSSHNKSISHSLRFDSLTLDCSYLHRGIRKFPLADSHSHNIAQVIQEKSAPERTPKFSSQRKAEHQRTKENFSSEVIEKPRSRSKSPNPLTGQGYLERKTGIRTVFEGMKEKAHRKGERKHFDIYY